ncbi:MAG: heavy metal translocating P-type ATPase [Betaproteobacteria bacterium]
MSNTPALRKAKVPVAAGEAAPADGACDHCGDALAGLKIVRRAIGGRDGRYCCLGCAFIAEQLFLAQAGSRDRAQLAAQAPEPPTGPRAQAQIDVQGMVCAACGLLIEHRLKQLPGVAAAQVDFGARRASIAYDPTQLTVADAERAIERAGYRTHPTAQDERRAQRIDLLRLMLAWLAMMQVMMLAVPTYLAAPGDIPPDIAQLLRLAQLVLTTPVLLFSALPIWRAALNQLRMRAIGMDLPIALGLAVAFGASAQAVLRAQGEVYFDSITMFVALVYSSRWIQARALARAYAHIDAARRGLRLLALKLRAWPASHATDPVPAEQLAPGDLVLVPAGESVPADGVVRDGASTVSQAWLTGESTPIDKGEGAPVLAGSINLEQPLVVAVTRAGEATALAALRRLVDEAGRERPPIVELANRAAVWFLWAVLAVTAATVLGWWWVDPARALPNAIAVLIATCPCALSLAAPAALAAVQSGLARRGVLTARVAALEQLARVDAFAFDKTGTLTTAEPALTQVVLFREVSADDALTVAAALESLSVHPFARAIVTAAQARRLPAPEAQAGRVQASAGVEATVAGRRYRIGKADYALGLVQTDPQPVAARLLRRVEREGLQAASTIVLADGNGPLALFAFGERLRPDARLLVDAVRAAGAQPLLVSGDRREPVRRVARELGIQDGEGDDGQRVYAHQTPESKRALIARLQGEGRVVAMLGDGMNDAPVIAQADVSLALAGGSQLAQARADLIVVSSRLADVAAAVKLTKKGLRIVRENLGWTLVYNIVIVPAAALGYLTPAAAAVGMAASSLLVVGNALRARRV